MKRLCALLGAALFALFAGVEFISPKEDNFFYATSDGLATYYQVQDSETVDYTALYGQVYKRPVEGAEACDITQRQDSRAEWIQLNTRRPNWLDAAGLYDPVYVSEGVAVTTTDNTITYVLSGEDECNVCAPAAGTINTSHYACNYGSLMEFLIEQANVTYTVTIEGAKCWYCCAYKEEPEGGRYSATTDSLKGKAMSAGDILCVGKAGTVVTVSRKVS